MTDSSSKDRRKASALLLHFYAETPVRAGGADSDGAIDLPIQREEPTGLPVIWAQSLKGAIKDTLYARGREDLVRLLGSEPEDRDEQDPTKRATKPGVVDIVDSSLVALPVPTLHSTLAWATSPLLISRLTRRLRIANAASRPQSPSRVDQRNAYVCPEHAVNGRRLAFGPFVLTAEADATVSELARWITDHLLPTEVAAFAEHIQRNLVVVDDRVLASLARECTEIHARVQLHRKPDKPEDKDQYKTVKNGPFHAEYLPSETIFTALALGPRDALARLGDALDGVWNIGGHESIGKGLVWCRPELVTAGDGSADGSADDGSAARP